MGVSSFVTARFRQKKEGDHSTHSNSNNEDPLARMARLIYDEMNIEPRQMHVAIQIAREHLQQVRERLVANGLRRLTPNEPANVERPA